MLQLSISARSAQQSALLALSGRLDLALAQLPLQPSAGEILEPRAPTSSQATGRSRVLDSEEPAAVNAFSEGVPDGASSGSESEELSDEDLGDADSEDDDDNGDMGDELL